MALVDSDPDPLNCKLNSSLHVSDLFFFVCVCVTGGRVLLMRSFFSGWPLSTLVVLFQFVVLFLNRSYGKHLRMQAAGRKVGMACFVCEFVCWFVCSSCFMAAGLCCWMSSNKFVMQLADPGAQLNLVCVL